MHVLPMEGTHETRTWDKSGWFLSAKSYDVTYSGETDDGEAE